MLCVWADQQAGQSTERSVPVLGLEPSDLLWFLKIILLLPPPPPNLRVWQVSLQSARIREEEKIESEN